MAWNIFSKLFKRKQSSERELSLTPEAIELLPAADDVTFYRDSKRLLQRFDEYITSAEVESETLSIELDDTLEQQDTIKTQLRTLNKPSSWHERHFLLKLDRLTLHGENLKQRIEIYAQNIKVYLNLISKIQDVKAMRMNGLDEEKIETIWLEFKDTVEEYQKRLCAEESGFQNETITSSVLELRLKKLRDEVIPMPSEEAAKEIPLIEKKSDKADSLRKPLVEYLEVKEKNFTDDLDDLDDLDEPELLLA